MKKLTLTKFREVLLTSPLELQESELKFTANVMGFDLKEFKKEDKNLEFEIHYQRTFIIKISIMDSLLMFSNPWIIFNAETNETFITLMAPPTLIDLITLFITMCGDGLLTPVNYSPGYIRGFSLTDNPEEAKAYFQLIQTVNDDLRHSREGTQPGTIPAKPMKVNKSTKKIVS